MTRRTTLCLMAAILTLLSWSYPVSSSAQPSKTDKDGSASQAPATKDSSTSKPPATTPPEVPTEGDREKEAEEVKRLQEFYLRNQSVFIKKGEYIVEFTAFYSTDTRQEFIPIAPGQSTLINTTRRFFDASLFGRAGIFTDGLELDVIVPFLVHADQEIDLVSGRTRSSTTGFGDAAAALRYQVWYERGARPGLIIDIGGKSTSGGTGLRGTDNINLGGGITLLKSIDPVVFFGRVGYTETLPQGGRNLGNIFEYSAGMGFALNDRVAFNMQLIGSYIGRSKIQGQTIDGSSLEIASLQFSSTILITRKLFIEPIVVVGMTEDAFNSTIGIRVPYRF
jgi:hypothetical protein